MCSRASIRAPTAVKFAPIEAARPKVQRQRTTRFSSHESFTSKPAGSPAGFIDHHMLTTNKRTSLARQPLNVAQGAPHTTATPNATTVATTTSPAQRTWLRLFDRGHSHAQRHPEGNSNPAPVQVNALTDDLPLVGRNYDFVEPRTWPNNVFYVSNNIFLVSRPFPCSKRSSSYRYRCGCDGQRCIADNGTHLSSYCENARIDLVCDDTSYSIGASCGNRFLSRFHLDIITTRVGLGIVSSSPIPKGAFIIEYVGEMLLKDDALKRSDRRYQVEMKTKALWDGPAIVFIDAAECGNESRFINHSCSPNCELYEWEWTNSARLGIFAASDIPPPQELAFRYRDSNLDLFTCHCGHPNCVSNNA